MLRTRRASAEAIFGDFSSYIREGKEADLEKLFPRGGIIVDPTADPLTAISLFAMINRRAIQEELKGLHADSSTPNWILDLTTTSLSSVLAYWGEVYDDLDVCCDRSKPLQADIDFFRVMVGRTEHLRVRMFEKERRLTFNLTHVPRLVESTDHPGVQIADVFASAVNRAFQDSYRGKADPREDEWLGLTRQCVLEDNVCPDLEEIDLRRPSGFVNSMVLHELTDRCLRKEDLFEGMPEFMRTAYEIFPRYLASNPP